jgi:hypothetical protein
VITSRPSFCPWSFRELVLDAQPYLLYGGSVERGDKDLRGIETSANSVVFSFSFEGKSTKTSDQSPLLEALQREKPSSGEVQATVQERMCDGRSERSTRWLRRTRCQSTFPATT